MAWAVRAPVLWLVALAQGVVGGLAPAGDARAHDTRPGYLEITEQTPRRYELIWRTPVFSGSRLSVVLRFPDGVRTQGEPVEREFRGSVVERRVIEAPHGLVGTRIEFIGLETTITDVLVRVQRSDGSHSTALVHPSQPWLQVQGSQGPWSTALVYLRHGVTHIAGGYDHLLFVLGLFLLVRGVRALVATITAFTAAHSVTLAVSTLEWVRVPQPPVEAIIALSLVVVAAEILDTQPRATLIRRRPWVVALSFGLLHGFGFAGALADIGLPGDSVPLALFAFNAGVEIGQLALISVFLLVSHVCDRLGASARSRAHARSLAAYSAGTLASFWFFERLAGFMP